MPSCTTSYHQDTLPDITHRRGNTKCSLRRVIFPTLYREINRNSTSDGSTTTLIAADSTSSFVSSQHPELIATVPKSKPKDTEELPTSSKLLSCNVQSKDNPLTPIFVTKTLHQPPLQTLEISDVTPPRKSATTVILSPRPVVLNKYQVPTTANLSNLSSQTFKEQRLLSGGKPSSILRAQSLGASKKVVAPGSTSSSLPSFQSLQHGEDGTTSSQSSIYTAVSQPGLAIHSQRQEMRRSISESGGYPRKHSPRIQFDPHVWIREFERTPEEQACTWYGDDDMERFKRQSLALMMARDRLAATEGSLQQKKSTGPIRTLPYRGKGSAFYTHSALSIEGDDSASESAILTNAMQNDRYRAVVARQEIKRILLVDRHDICITLFRKAFVTLLPKVEIMAASSAPEALEQIASNNFDVILVEERLQPLLHRPKGGMSGSDLFRTLATIQCNGSRKQRSAALWIGVSSHLAKDRLLLQASGADICWGKPPPKMSDFLRNEVLYVLLRKRGQLDFCHELFGTTTVSL